MRQLNNKNNKSPADTYVTIKMLKQNIVCINRGVIDVKQSIFGNY